ncbi:unnamed protein product [Spirodela intermedia]|uniref:Uncharacterized protein n=1 Tax=Spirodela intermedia TaxID=51605 RepID=A0A7I8L7C9_SPIIN|nr:unnamed protein product [Spirodela intermedia]
MNLRFLNNLPSPPLFPLLPLPWRTEPEPKPVPSPSPLPSPKVSGGGLSFDLRDAIVRSFQSLVSFRWNPFAPHLPISPGRSARKERVEPTGCALQLFRPYVAKVPWHGGARAFLSQLFPRYGHYCGPNWSSGKDGGMPLWDRRPIDWLDFCCYCHDIGYDTHDQAKLLQADLAFLECLERPRMSTKGDAHAAHLYKTMCIAGLRNILIPYRMQLVRMQTGPSFLEVMNSLIVKSRSCSQDSGKGL